MRHSYFITAFLICLSLLSVSCEREKKVDDSKTTTDISQEKTSEESMDEQPMEETDSKPDEESSVLAKMLWAKLNSSAYTKKWEHWPGKQPLYKGTQPHGMLLSTYLNPQAFNAVKSGADQMPYGSIIVKENYTKDRKLSAVTVMQRRQGYNTEAGDWFWAKYKSNGDIMTAGKVDGCISCHTTSASGIEFIMTVK